MTSLAYSAQFDSGGNCKRGHRLTPDNIHVREYKGETRRVCNTCRKQKMAEYRRNQRRSGLCGCGGKRVRGKSRCRRCVRRDLLRYKRDPARARDTQTRFRKRQRQLVFDHYGRKCRCCGETRDEFLSIDHIDGDGNAHRRSIGCLAGTAFYTWLIKNKFPKNFRTLCMNCNYSLGKHGYCPHHPRRSRRAVKLGRPRKY